MASNEQTLPAAAPEGWHLVPSIGARVKAAHPITCLNPDETFEVAEVRGESDGRFAVRGQKTCWFDLGMISPASAEGSAGDAPAKASGLSEFIRNASPERKDEVYGHVMERASAAQAALIAGDAPAAVQQGRCCYGGVKTKRDCASCAAWTPLAASPQPSPTGAQGVQAWMRQDGLKCMPDVERAAYASASDGLSASIVAEYSIPLYATPEAAGVAHPVASEKQHCEACGRDVTPGGICQRKRGATPPAGCVTERAASPSPQAAGVARARMLTEAERSEVLDARMADLSGTDNIANMLQRKFCEVNGIALSAGTPAPSDQPGASVDHDDEAPWQVDVWSDGRVVLQAHHGDHDTALIVNGDFGGVEQRAAYARTFAARLNRIAGVDAPDKPDSYDAIWNALQRIDAAAAMLPTYAVKHEGGIEAFTQNIVDAIAGVAPTHEMKENKHG